MKRGLYTIPAGVPFAGTLARGLIQQLGAERDPLALSSATIYLPTRRAVRVLGETFARVLEGAALLPDMRPLGDIDEEDVLFDPSADDLAIPPALDPVRRRLLLATLVRRWAEQRRDLPPGFAQAAAMARNLAHFLDEAETQQADLEKLHELVPGPLAEHWADVRDFLLFLRREWPKLLAVEGDLDPAERRNLLLAQLTRRYRHSHLQSSVIAAGTTGSIPATAELLDAIARLPAGAVVLPGLDRELDAESWSALEPGHPQYGMKQLLDRMGVARADVRDWPGTPAPPMPRVALVRETLRPAPTTDAWRALADSGSAEIAEGLDGIGIVEAAHPGEEALAIALMLREAVEEPGKTAALVTPDRGLARRVAAELGRWNIAIDDSAGVPLAQTPPAVFLSLLAEAAAEEFAPVPLLSLLKHPLAVGQDGAAGFRRHVRLLDKFVLRGPRPDPGLGGIAKAIASKRAEKDDSALAPVLDDLRGWFDKLARLLRPFAEAMRSRAISLAELVQFHRDAAEQLVSAKDELWRGDAGEAAAKLIEALIGAGEDLPAIEASAYPILFRQFAEERAIRPAFGRHPRLAILGPLEARLQHFDLVVLGGLNDGIWPHSAAADPWLSRPMRAALGLESPERAIGLAAHDFAMLAAMPRVRLTRSLKVDGTPTVASRWLQRLQQLTKGLQLDAALESAKHYAALAMLFATPDHAPQAAKRPAPRPPLDKRPRELSITRIETWLRDPYAIYARHVLRLKPLDPLDAEIGPMDRGSAMHEILERFIGEAGDALPSNAVARLIGISEEVFASYGVPQSALAVWRPRFARAAAWFVDDERKRRGAIARSFLEIKGSIAIDAPGGKFVLSGRADRIDELHAGGAAIIDYKTGRPPSDSQVGVFAPQLPLEGAILERGGFDGVAPLAAAQLVYIQFSGGEIAGDTHVVKGDPRELVAQTYAKLLQLITDFDREETGYVSRVAPFRVNTPGDYDHLARVREWSLSGWDGST
ncbi:MAG TPA: double-strand break repair protein AddB [Rhizomicrobium sp.]|jgi:ATP-dependent helicase/nuclease subunit B|nr:double-strand break repair protein AddB [Rhizomicrobium sp.]